MKGAATSASRRDDALLSVDDELDAHPAMLPLVQLMERGAALWEQVRFDCASQVRHAVRVQAHDNIVRGERICLIDRHSAADLRGMDSRQQLRQ